MPTFKNTPPSIAIEVNPANAATSTTITRKGRGIIIRSDLELEQFNKLLSNLKVLELAMKIEAVNPQIKEGTMRSSSTNTDVFEI